jgi:adenine-specific DNA glycosylase
MSAKDKQVGGNHYKKMNVEVYEFCMVNNIPFVEGNIIKYVCRYKDKGGLDDLNKAKHYLEMLIESMADPNYEYIVTNKP